MRLVALLLALCVMPCLFIIPVLCDPVELSISEEEDFCLILPFVITSDVLILAEAIIYPSIPDGFTLLKNDAEFFHIPLVFFVKDKPPSV